MDTCIFDGKEYTMNSEYDAYQTCRCLPAHQEDYTEWAQDCTCDGVDYKMFWLHPDDIRDADTYDWDDIDRVEVI